METRTCGSTGSISKRYYQLRWTANLTCPAGFTPATGPSSAQWPRVCNGGSVLLRKQSLENVTSCPHTDHPCAPATGEKLLTEVDFTWRGHPFTRMYASGHETPAQSGLGPTWSHAWTLRLTPPTSVSPSSLGELRTARNDVVQFKYIAGSTSVMAAVGARDQVLQRETDGGWLLTTNAGDAIRFDSTGALRSMGPADDPSQQLTFDVAGAQILAAHDATGRSLTFVYDQGMLAGVRDDAGVELATYTYDAAKRLTAVTFPDGKSRQYAYGEVDHLCVGASSSCSSSFFQTHLTGVTDAAGRRVLDASYDESGRVVASIQPGASTTTLTYGAVAQTEVTQSGEGRVAWTFSNDLMRRPLARKVYDGATLVSSETWTYASDSSYTLYTNPDGVVTRTTYDARGLELTRVEAESKNGNTSLPDKRTTVTTWSTGTTPRPATVTVQDAAGTAVLRSEVTYNGRGQPVAITVTDPRTARSREETRVYCESGDVGSGGCAVVGQLLGTEAPGGGVTSYAYRTAPAPGCAATSCDYRAGDLHQMTDAVGHTQSIDRYDAAGRPIALTDANGVQTTLSYDARGRMRATNVGGRATAFTYDAGGFLASVTDADGVVLHTTHDALGRLTDVRDGLGNTIHYTLDAAGGRVKEEVHDSSGTLSRSLSRVFDALGHVKELRDALGRTVQSYGYDASGRPTSAVDGRGVSHRWSYDPLGRLVSSVDDVGGTDAGTANATTSMAYDALNQLVGVSDPDGLPTIYDRDGLGNLTGQHSPDTAESGFTYDDAGNPLTATDARGITTTRTFDALGRVLTESYPNAAENAVYTYDEPDTITGCAASLPIGRLTRVVEASGVSTVYCYDGQGQVTRKTQTIAGKASVIGYAYTPAGRLASITYPSGARVAYTHDAAGQVAAATLHPPGGGNAQPIATNVHYAPFGPVASYTLGNGQTVARTFDANGEIAAVTSAAVDLQFTRDVLGNITALSGAETRKPTATTPCSG
ncbi:DUF6531 domain-containing protein [Rhodanobacter thiooxydans]|uniref:DUF6531 domain-containing protein n=1 Tax=Rhodanobacter thiooxydans TaxID=416169 RepID=UPI001F31116A|nr:DUF6531 domain-containing protein [Rhodanobacter thiooxydans]UJJ56801.1 DUF6531 domain-containing protein [Rhodanobacter thiooxydans]